VSSPAAWRGAWGLWGSTGRLADRVRPTYPNGRGGGLARLAAPLAIGLVVPALTFLILRHEPLVAVSAFTLAVPVLTMTRPQWIGTLAVPILLLAPVLPTVREPLLRGVALAAAIAIGMHLAGGTLALRPAHGWIAAFAVTVVLSLMLPALHLPTKTYRFSDAAYLLVGLALAGLAITAPPPPGQLAVAVAGSGALVAGYVLYAGHLAGGRLVGLGLNPNYLGSLLVVPLLTGAGLAWSRRQARWLLAAAPCLAALAATKSRGALVAVAAGALLLLISTVRRRHRPWLIALGAVGTVLALLGALSWLDDIALGGRSSAELDRNNSIRAHIALVALRVAAHHPLRGIGYGMFPPYAARNAGIYLNTHNDYLRLAVEGGLAMLITFTVLLWLALRPPHRGDLGVLRAAVFAYAVSLVFANTLANLAITGAFWVALGCLIARSGRARTPAPGTG
jgi:hypothetical protein